MSMFVFPLLCLTVQPAHGDFKRIIPASPGTRWVRVHFNNESITAGYLVLDARSAREQQEDLAAGRLKGPAIVFFQGHAQRPSDAIPFTSRLAAGSRSGIVVVPVCDTPYGADEHWRGDQGKMAVLMEVVRAALASRSIRVEGYSPLTDEACSVGGWAVDDRGCQASAGLTAVGWSHGGILARMFAHSYPASVSALGQVCPAGYERTTPMGLTGRFAKEALRISRITAGSNAGDALRSAWGFTRGFCGDFARSVPEAAIRLHPAKILRTYHDVRECSAYQDSTSTSLGHVQRVVVIFGQKDTCMSPRRIVGVNDAAGLDSESAGLFWKKYYADVPADRASLSLEILPGTHLGPVTHSDLYASALLSGLGELPLP